MRISNAVAKVIGQPTLGVPVVEYRWAVRQDDGAVVADHRLAITQPTLPVDPGRFAGALFLGASPVEAATGLAVRWRTETRPRVIRPQTMAGSQFGIDAPTAALTLIERGEDPSGAIVVEHDATALTTHSSHPEALQPVSPDRPRHGRLRVIARLAPVSV